MATGRQRLARQQIAAATAGPSTADVAVVTSITGTGTDGNTLVTVTFRGATHKFPHLLQYTPVVGHVVAVQPWNGTYLILGRPGGFPPVT